MNYTNQICSFTGYRTQKLNACLSKNLTVQDIKNCIKSQMLEMLDRGFNTFQCGMALGTDLMFAEAALELRQKYSSNLIKFIAVIPCLDHNKGWNERDRILCREIIEKADDTVLVSNSSYFDGCMAKRNRYLVETCDELLAVYNGQHGGTMQTINYAKGREIKITIIDPSKSLIITLKESHKTEKPFLQGQNTSANKETI